MASVTRVVSNFFKESVVKLASFPLSDRVTEGSGEGRNCLVPRAAGTGGAGSAAPALNEVLPPKRQAVVDRLRRRIESYRRHQNDCIPRFDQSFNGVVEQNIQDTLVLKQRFLENKAKRAAKKSDKKPSDSSTQSNTHALPKFGNKRSVAEENEGGVDTFCEGPPSKVTQSSQPSSASASHQSQSQQTSSSTQQSSQQSQPQENLTKFSVEIVQQLEFTTSTTNSQISTNVTVKATSVKSDLGSRGTSPRVASPCPNEPVPPQPPQEPLIAGTKQEQEDNPEFVDLEQCAAALEKDAHGGNTLAAFPDFIGGDNSDGIITSDTFKDLISEISDINPEFMKDFDFDGGASTKCKEIDKKPQIKVEEMDKCCSRPASNNRLLFTGLSELSPAAQTLKQMAEQHQHKNHMSFNPVRESIKQEVFPGSPASAGVSFGSRIPSPQAQTRLGPQIKAQYTSFPSGVGSGAGNCSSGPGFRSQGRASPRPPANIQVNQAQQVLVNQQGPLQVQMGQSISAEMKSNAVSVGAQQAMFVSGDNPNYCAISQSQSTNFNQQNLMQRTPTNRKPTQIRVANIELMTGSSPNHGQGGVHQSSLRPAPPEYNKNQSMLHNIMAQRFGSQPRMVSFQPMPPSGPMIRSQNQYLGNIRLYNNMNRAPVVRQPSEPNDWRQMPPMPQQRTQFHQTQGVVFNSNGVEINTGQIQHMSHVSQQQSIGLHHSNPNMSVNVQMNQNMGGVYGGGNGGGNSSQPANSNRNIPHLQVYGTNNYTMASNSSPSGFNSPSFPSTNQTLYHQPTSISPDLSLDFLEQLPSSENTNFSEQELLNSLESNTSFNLQDIL